MVVYIVGVFVLVGSGFLVFCIFEIFLDEVLYWFIFVGLVVFIVLYMFVLEYVEGYDYE